MKFNLLNIFVYVEQLTSVITVYQIPSFVLIHARQRASPLLENIEEDEMSKPTDIAFTGVHRQRRITGEGIAECREISNLEEGTVVAVEVIIRFMKTNSTF